MRDPNQLVDTFFWFDAARGTKPALNYWHNQLGVHFEEVTEMLAEISSDDSETRTLIEKAKLANHQLAEHLKKNANFGNGLAYILPEDRKAFLDAACDQIVTATGVAHHARMDLPGAMAEVNRGNYSKFVDGAAIFDDTGKIAKGPDYVKPDLTPYVNRL